VKLSYFEEALRLDPSFALAHADLAYYYVLLSGDFVPSVQAFSMAKDHIAKALELDSNLANIWTAKRQVAYQSTKVN
jgi:Tfp pilus assembly protein PilF